jgi:hypothetical protein
MPAHFPEMDIAQGIAALGTVQITAAPQACSSTDLLNSKEAAGMPAWRKTQG